MNSEITSLYSIPFSKEALDKSFLWLTDPEIKYLTNSPALTREGQLSWFKTLASKENYIAEVVCADNEMIGVVGLKNMDRVESRAEYFGYIGDKNYWGKGIGNWIVDRGLALTENNGIAIVYLRVIVENYKAINLYFKKGFKIVSYEYNSFTMQRTIVQCKC